jgi:dTDP-4-dehydrorhamnose reductase
VTCFDPPDPRTGVVVEGLRSESGTRDAGGVARTGPTLFSDEFRCPIRTGDLAQALVELVANPFRGVLHIAGPERLSRYGLGLRIARFHGLDPSGIRAGTAADDGLVRPRDCTLDTALAREVLKTILLPLP